ncbi:MAG TPA: RNA polymerase sigma factor [Solirubrobacteraceae bacterium]|jgi:RNA polymerase sigma-70 factor (ECF subfamily)
MARRARTREESAAACFERIYREHGDRIYRFFLRRTGDAPMSEDLRSAVFFEAWRRRAEVNLATRDPLPWLYGVATNVLRNHNRATRRCQAALMRLALPDPEPDPADDVVQRLDAAAEAHAALALVRRLPPAERAVFALCVGQGLSYGNAAKRLGVPVGTVRSRLSRARSRLEQRRTTTRGTQPTPQTETG